MISLAHSRCATGKAGRLPLRLHMAFFLFLLSQGGHSQSLVLAERTLSYDVDCGVIPRLVGPGAKLRPAPP